MIRKITNGIPRGADVVLLVLLLLGSSVLTRGASAQAVDRTDTPKQGELRVKFDPRILTWSRSFTTDGTEPLGAPLRGDTLGVLRLPMIARLQQDLRTASGIPGYVASLGQGLFSARAEVRVMPITAEIGVTNRLSFAVTVPVVRVGTRTHFSVTPTGTALGANPLARVSGADGEYATFFSQFSTALTRLGDSISSGHYGCPGSPQCIQAQSFLAQGQAIRDALRRTVYGVGATGSPFVPLVGSGVGDAIDSTVAALQDRLENTYNVGGFDNAFLLSTDTVTAAVFGSFFNDTSYGFGYRPLSNAWHYGLGDLALRAKYRVGGGTYAASLAGLVRLPTGSRDTTLEVLDIPVADHQLAFEATLTQELTLVKRVWLNLAVRAGTAKGSTRARRVAPIDAFLVPFQATTVLTWDPGDYVAIDFAPMYRFTPAFGVGCTVGYLTKAVDHYSFQSVEDSLALATRMGVPIPASILDQGTAQSSLRVGLAVTYAAPRMEGGFSVEKTVSGEGGPVPAATVFRIVLRVDWPFF